jgi:glycosyltransferase involved in cell wall biosynthesis
VNHGISVDVATTDDNGPGHLVLPLGRPIVENGVTYWYFRRQASFYTVSWPLFWWLAKHVDMYDLVHIHGLFSFACTAGAFWANRRGVPYLVRPLGVLNTWGIRNRRPLLKRLSLHLIESRILANSAAAHFTTEQEMAEAKLSAPGTRSVVIPNPVIEVDERAQQNAGLFFASYPELAGRRVVLFLSRLDPIKGIDLLLTAFARIRILLPDAVLVMAGKGDESFLAALRDQANQLGLQNDVVWVGFLEAEDKRAAFAAAYTYVLPSYSESFGIAIVEAMAHGVPVIVSDQVGIHREIAKNGAGLVVKCDSTELERALFQMLSNPSLRQEMSANSRRMVAKFSPEVVTTRLCHTYLDFGIAAAVSKRCDQ